MSIGKTVKKDINAVKTGINTIRIGAELYKIHAGGGKTLLPDKKPPLKRRIKNDVNQAAGLAKSLTKAPLSLLEFGLAPLASTVENVLPKSWQETIDNKLNQMNQSQKPTGRRVAKTKVTPKVSVAKSNKPKPFRLRRVA